MGVLRTVEGCGVILISRDWILPLVPLFSRDEKIAPNFAKNLTVPSFGEFSYKQTAQQMKTGKYFFKRAIIAPNFGEKNIQVSIYPFSRNRVGRVGSDQRADYRLLRSITK